MTLMGDSEIARGEIGSDSALRGRESPGPSLGGPRFPSLNVERPPSQA
jgi:hypothetical protein